MQLPGLSFVVALTHLYMLKHLESVDGRLASIDNNVATLTETVQQLIKKDFLLVISAEYLPQLASYLAETLEKQAAAPIDELEPLLDKTQVMDYLDIKDTAYYRWVKEGKLKPRGGNGRHRYFLSDIKKLMEQRTYRKRG